MRSRPVDLSAGEVKIELLRSFWAKVAIQSDGCWLWTASIYPSNGYGFFRNRKAHRIAYELMVGPVPAGLELDHLCHTLDVSCPGRLCRHRLCVNPNHLEPVTRSENTLRGVHRRRLLR